MRGRAVRRLFVGHLARGDVGLNAQNRLDAGCVRRLVELDQPVEGPVVGERQRRHALVFRLRHHLRNPGEAVEHGVLGMNVQVGEFGHSRSHRASGRKGQKNVIAGPSQAFGVGRA